MRKRSKIYYYYSSIINNQISVNICISHVTNQNNKFDLQINFRCSNKLIMVNDENLLKDFQEKCKIIGEGVRHGVDVQRCAGRCVIDLGDVTKHNVMQLKKLNMSVFPVFYNDKFYKEVITAGELAKLAYFNDIIVGGVCCRIDLIEGQKKLYIMTLGTLAPYRRFGIGTLLLDHVFSLCQKDAQIKVVYLHVQTNNESALNFYKHFGFEITGRVEKYYKRIEPDDAYILEKSVNLDMR